MLFEPGCKVRVVNPNHWLLDREGHVVKPTIEANMKKFVAAGADRVESVGIPVDFEERLSGWLDSPFGRRKAVTHNCDGALKGETGYYMLERDLELLDIPGGRPGRVIIVQ